MYVCTAYRVFRNEIAAAVIQPSSRRTAPYTAVPCKTQMDVPLFTCMYVCMYVRRGRRTREDREQRGSGHTGIVLVAESTVCHDYVEVAVRGVAAHCDDLICMYGIYVCIDNLYVFFKL